jgi:hypothetical protein
MQTSITTPSSTKLRLSALAPRIRGLGDRPVYELLCELVSLSSAAMGRVEAYGAIGLHADLIRAYGGTEMPATIVRIK